MASRPMVTCSPVASTMSISRGSGVAVMAWARATRPSVVLPIAETTTTSRWPRRGGRGHAPGDVLDLFGIGDGRAAVLLDDQLTHEKVMLHEGRADCKGTAALVRPAPSAPRAGTRAGPAFVTVRTTGVTLATVRSLSGGRAAVASSRSTGTVLAAILPRALAWRSLLSYLIARVLALRRRHLAPPLRVPLEALTLIGAHGLIALETLPELLLLLLGRRWKRSCAASSSR